MYKFQGFLFATSDIVKYKRSQNIWYQTVWRVSWVAGHSLMQHRNNLKVPRDMKDLHYISDTPILQCSRCPLRRFRIAQYDSPFRGGGLRKFFVRGCACRALKFWFSLYLFMSPFTTHQYTNFDQKQPMLLKLGAFYNNLLTTHQIYGDENALITIPKFAKKKKKKKKKKKNHPRRQVHIRIPCQCENLFRE